jgi:hypothetical protein
MDQQFDFRVLLLKLQDCLSENDRILSSVILYRDIYVMIQHWVEH